MMSVERIAHFVRPRTFMMDLLLLRVSKLRTYRYLLLPNFFYLHGESEFQKNRLTFHSFFTKMKKYHDNNTYVM